MSSRLVDKIRNMEVPENGNSSINVMLGVVNIFFFGFGMIAIGILNKDPDDLIIGILQLLVPLVGWIWAILWVSLEKPIQECQCTPTRHFPHTHNKLYTTPNIFKITEIL
ncbi:conserved Plasmodium protein, unknown function [Plasmodium chabaudi chabaudi]|uniref:Transmembrane protein n=3 Tax=Plasmodium chabaudi TaxID=5825 RepID=A0A1D3LBV1_PLACU|nr:conserved Plasmodium protein, unknown function [Plasmodium chabaudi chabaudi]SCM01509.1 conserved Plasmodium protein, unknown function [Plasmodium chabaudi adami]